MIRRHRYAVALVCLAALAVALALPDAVQVFTWLAEPVATIVPAPAAGLRVTDGAYRPSAVSARSRLAPRAPPPA
jgi:hypothetical protein